MRSATIDSSCVIALDRLDLLRKASYLFSRLLLPKTVRKEPFRRTDFKHRLRRLRREFNFIEYCDDYDQFAVDQFLIEARSAGWLDRGEAETVVQASKRGAELVIMDDPRGRQFAGKFRLECHGTLWILQRFHQLDLLNPAQVKSHLEHLLRTGYRISRRQANTMLKEIGESPLEIR